MPNAIFFYRIQRWLYLHHIPFLPKLIQLLIFLIYNTKITADSKIGKGSYFVCKGISTVLIPGTEIGENCVLGLRFSTVRKFPYKNVPKIGNNVFIGPNVVICGPVEIGDNCIVAANSFVDKSLRGGVIVAGSPAKIIGYTKDLNYNISLKSATKLFSVLLASKRPLITELADKLRLKYPLLPTISPCPTMRLEAIRSIIPISCRRYPKSV